MKSHPILTAILAVAALPGLVSTLSAQGSALTYQGRLSDSGQTPTGLYDLRFSLYDAAAGGSQVGSTVALAPVGVTNGLFTVVLDFGTSPFNGAARWLQLAVRTNGSAAALVTMAPRQALTAAPYAIAAGAVTGPVADAQLSGNIARLNGSPVFTGTATFSPATGAPFSVGANGNRVANLNADFLDGLDSGAFWKVGGNVGLTSASQYFGASDSAQVRLHATGGFLVDNTTPSLSFGSQTRQMLNLWGTNYGIGVQNNTLYQRSDGNFAWHRKGQHNDGGGNPGPGGTNLMTLDGTGELFVISSVTLDSNSGNDGTLRPGLLFGYGTGEGISSKRTAGGNQYGIDFYTGFNARMSLTSGGRLGLGTTAPEDALLDVEGEIRVNDHDIFLRGGSDRNHGVGYRSTVSGQTVDGAFVYGFNGGALGVAGPDSISLRWDWEGNVWVSNHLDVASFNVRGAATVKVLEITGGADVAEPFHMSAGGPLPPGTVVVIDEASPGQLKMSERAYDTRVAGIVSGANGVRPGLALHQEGRLDGGQNVALTGRVYALADAGAGSIQPGDLLTTSDTPGHLMKAGDRVRGAGAILGKAMTPLAGGRGLVLVLVSLQ